MNTPKSETLKVQYYNGLNSVARDLVDRIYVMFIDDQQVPEGKTTEQQKIAVALKIMRPVRDDIERLLEVLSYPEHKCAFDLLLLERERDALLKAAKAVKYKDIHIEGDDYAPRTWRTERVLEGLDELHKVIASIEAKDK